MSILILAINPGSTSTKIAIFRDETEIFQKTLRHSAEEIAQYPKIIDQFRFRKVAILDSLKENGIEIENIRIIVGRGGLLRPIPSGVYKVNSQMIDDMTTARMGEHASNLGGIIADDLAKEIKGCEAYIADPVVVDELCDVARISGHPLFKRVSIFHALNQKAVAKGYARSIGKNYNEMNLIMAHLGGGVSVGAHLKGQVIDVNNALNGEGPFSPERSGTLPALQLAQLCFSGDYTFDQVKKIITGQGGVVAYLGTNSFVEVAERVAAGDQQAKLIADAFVFNIAKGIGAAAAVLSGNVDTIILTGGIAYATEMMKQISEMVKFIAPVVVVPGEDEMSALAMNGLAVYRGEEIPKDY